MAATRLIAMHMNKGRTIAQCLKDRTDYAKNEAKTMETIIRNYWSLFCLLEKTVY